MGAGDLDLIRAFLVTGEADVVPQIATRRTSSGQPIENVLAPDASIRFVGSAGVELSGSGPEGFIRCWSSWLEPWESYVIRLEDLREDGDRIVALVRNTARLKDTDLDVEQVGAAVYRVRDGLIVDAEFHDRRDTIERVPNSDSPG